MAHRRWNVADLAREAGIDPGTVGDFLSGTTWPQRSKQNAMEDALGLTGGTIAAAASGHLTRAGAVDLDELRRAVNGSTSLSGGAKAAILALLDVEERRGA